MAQNTPQWLKNGNKQAGLGYTPPPVNRMKFSMPIFQVL
jgi:hypothetical protein